MLFFLADPKPIESAGSLTPTDLSNQNSFIVIVKNIICCKYLDKQM